MAQNYQDIPATQSLSSSRSLLLDRDAAAASSFSGSAFPTSNLLVGMRCHRTDLNKIYVLKDLTPTWIEVEDVSGTVGAAPRAVVLATARNFSVAGDVTTAAAVSFNGSADVTLNVSLASQPGLIAGSYAKVTVNAKGLVTGATQLVSGDLPADLTPTTVRVTGTGAASLASTGHGFQIGPDAGANLIADQNDIQARNNGAAAALGVNALGGNVTIGNATSTVTIAGTLSVASGLSLPAGAVATSTIADGAVTAAKIADGNVTAAKIADGNVTAAKIASAAVSSAKINFATGSLAWSTGTNGGTRSASVPATTILGFNVGGSATAAFSGTDINNPTLTLSTSNSSNGTFVWRYIV